jgi:hypothetical protein
MAQQLIQNAQSGETGLSSRTKINENFTELYNLFQAPDVEQIQLYDPQEAYLAGNVFVTYSSQNEPFLQEAIYRCAVNAAPGESPETNPEKWIYQGAVAGSIPVESIIDLQNQLNQCVHISGNEQIEGIKNFAEGMLQLSKGSGIATDFIIPRDGNSFTWVGGSTLERLSRNCQEGTCITIFFTGATTIRHLAGAGTDPNFIQIFNVAALDYTTKAGDYIDFIQLQDYWCINVSEVLFKKSGTDIVPVSTNNKLKINDLYLNNIKSFDTIPIRFYKNDGTTVALQLTINTAVQLQLYGRLMLDQGAQVSVANDIEVGSDGNTFLITGNGTLNRLSINGIDAGMVVHLLFSGNVTITNKYAVFNGTYKSFAFSDNLDYTTLAGELITFIFCNDGYWHTDKKSVAVAGHNHDDLYYTIDETDQAILDSAETRTSIGDLLYNANAAGALSSDFWFAVVSSTRKILEKLNGQTLKTLIQTAVRSQGSNIASANDIILAFGYNAFFVTGTTQINRISNGDIWAGYQALLIFNESLTIANNVTSGSNYQTIVTHTGTDYTTSIGEVVAVMYMSDEKWYITGTSKVSASTALGFTPVNEDLAAYTEKITIADNDKIFLNDSEDSNTPKYNLFSVIKSTLKTYFDSLYAAIGNLILTALSTTETVNGITANFTAADTVAFGDICYINSSGQAKLAKADAIANANATLMAAGTITATNSGIFLLYGRAKRTGWSWTVGSANFLFLSTTGTTGNTLTQTAPAATNNVVQIVGFPVSATEIMFNPNLVQVEHV